MFRFKISFKVLFDPLTLKTKNNKYIIKTQFYLT